MKCETCKVDLWIVDGGYMRVYDGCVALRCPECKKEIPYDDSERAKRLFEKYKKALGEK